MDPGIDSLQFMRQDAQMYRFCARWRTAATPFFSGTRYWLCHDFAYQKMRAEGKGCSLAPALIQVEWRHQKMAQTIASEADIEPTARVGNAPAHSGLMPIAASVFR